jgi:hypothetical protein
VVISSIVVATVAHQKIIDQYVKIMENLDGEMNVGGIRNSCVLVTLDVVMNVLPNSH